MFKLFAKIAVLLAVAAPFPAYAADEKLPVVATFSILGDMAGVIGGEQIALTTLVGPEQDAHSYSPTAADLKAIQGAKVVIINGLGFEHWVERLLKSANYQGMIVVASTGIMPREMEEDGEVGTDPHAWQNLANGRIYARNIASAFAQVDAPHAALYNERLKAYDAQLATLDETTHKQFAALAAEHRTIITSHDAFGYFGAAYGVTFLAPAGLSTEDEPSAAAIASLIAQLKSHKVKTVFIENMSSPRLVKQMAEDTGTTLGGTLYADALSGKDGEASSYLSLFAHNAKLLHAALTN